MPTGNDDCDERQSRLEWMIDEFRKAQMRRLMHANDRAVESRVESDTTTAVTCPAPSR